MFQCGVLMRLMDGDDGVAETCCPNKLIKEEAADTDTGQADPHPASDIP